MVSVTQIIGLIKKYAVLSSSAVAVAAGGTGATTASGARTSLGVPSKTDIDVGFMNPGVMSNSQTPLLFVATRAFTLPQDLTGSQAKAGVAATASTTLTIYVNGVSKGTIVWAISGTVATFTFANAVSIAAGDIIKITGPATADATLADIAVTLMGQ